MEKKSYAPKVTKFLQEEDGSKLETSYPQMNCKFCNKELTKAQIYEFIRGKSKGNCSRICGNLARHYNDISERPKYTARRRKIFGNTCKVCGEYFESTVKYQKMCGLKCSGVIAAERMRENNPMKSQETRQKASDTLKRIGHKPIVLGGNGRGATKFQQILFDQLTAIDDSFELEVIEKTSEYAKQFRAPNHYKIDIASRKNMIAIEVDGFSHNSNKIKECDERKTVLLNLKGWKVLRLSNSQIEKELANCVQMVMSMI